MRCYRNRMYEIIAQKQCYTYNEIFNCSAEHSFDVKSVQFLHASTVLSINSIEKEIIVTQECIVILAEHFHFDSTLEYSYLSINHPDRKSEKEFISWLLKRKMKRKRSTKSS